MQRQNNLRGTKLNYESASEVKHSLLAEVQRVSVSDWSKCRLVAPGVRGRRSRRLSQGQNWTISNLQYVSGYWRTVVRLYDNECADDHAEIDLCAHMVVLSSLQNRWRLRNLDVTALWESKHRDEFQVVFFRIAKFCAEYETGACQMEWRSLSIYFWHRYIVVTREMLIDFIEIGVCAQVHCCRQVSIPSRPVWSDFVHFFYLVTDWLNGVQMVENDLLPPCCLAWYSSAVSMNDSHYKLQMNRLNDIVSRHSSLTSFRAETCIDPI